MIEHSMVVGLFETRTQAEQAIDELQQAGFSRDQIGFAVRDEGGEASVHGPGTEAGTAAATGAVSGGIIGGVLGAAASLIIPGFGPALAGGLLVATLGGAAIGAAAGSVLGGLMGMGIPEEDARYYESELQIGHTLVAVNAPGREHVASEILYRHGANDAMKRYAVRSGTLDTSPSPDTMASTNSVFEHPVGSGSVSADPRTRMPRIP
jgi:hypothetical protein